MISVLTGAAAGAVAGATLWRWLRTGRYRIVEDEPRLPLTRSWLVVPAATLAGGLAGVLSEPWLALAAWIYLVGSVAVAWIDLDVHRIPDRVLRCWAPALVTAVAANALTGEGWPLLGTAAAAAVAMAGGFFVLALIGSMGLGDVKLAAVTWFMVGSLGWAAVTTAVLAAFGAGAVAGVLLIARGANRTAHLAFGPAIIIGAATSVAQTGLRG